MEPVQCRCSRRTLLSAGAGLLAAGSIFPLSARAQDDSDVSRAEFGTHAMPTPIKEIDKNGHHNVPPGPYTEPSEILNFQGDFGVGVLVGSAHDNHGRALTLGGAGTDVRFLRGNYVTADGKTHSGTFTHL